MEQNKFCSASAVEISQHTEVDSCQQIFKGTAFQIQLGGCDNFWVIGKDRRQKIPLQECQQEHHKSTAEGDSYRYKECLCGAADIVCPDVLRNKSGKGRHKTHGYQRKENKKFFRDADAGRSNNPQGIEDGCNDQKGYRYLKILGGNGQPQRNDSADSAFLFEVRKFQAEGQAMLFGIFHIDNGEEKAACLGDDCCKSRTCCGHMKQSYKNQIQNDVDGAGDQYKQNGDLELPMPRKIPLTEL